MRVRKQVLRPLRKHAGTHLIKHGTVKKPITRHACIILENIESADCRPLTHGWGNRRSVSFYNCEVREARREYNRVYLCGGYCGRRHKALTGLFIQRNRAAGGCADFW